MANEFINNENRARLRNSINRPTPMTADGGVAAARPANDLPPSIRPDRPLDENPHSHRAAATISPDARADLAKLSEEKRGRMNAYLRRNG